MKQSTLSSIKQANGKVRRARAERSSHQLVQTPRLRKQLERLLKLRDHLDRVVGQLRTEACEEYPSYSLHMADAATDSFDRDLLLGLASFEQEGLYEIDAALKRLEDGTYGICELTGKPIGWKRLEAIPWTRFSLEAEKQLERHMSPHVGKLDSVWSAEKETYDASDDFANHERVLTADLNLFQTYLRAEPQIRPANVG